MGSSTKSNKEKAKDFLVLTSKGKSREAFSLYVAPSFKHHNAHFKGDANTLMMAMEENAAMMPNMIFEIQRALEDGDLVAVHSRFKQTQDDLGYAIMHILRFDESGKVAELWDFGQAVPKDMVNENGMF